MAEAEAQQIVEVQSTLAKLRPDILLVQEVRDFDSVNENIAGKLSLTLHVVSRFPISHRAGGLSKQQLAIMSRLEADAAWSQAFDAGDVEPPRGFCFAALRTGTNRILVYTVHLKSNLGNPLDNRLKREEAATQICRHANAMRQTFKTDRVLIAGDFNTDLPGIMLQEEETIPTMIKAGYFWTFQGVPREHRITFPGKGKYPPVCLDHAFVSGLGRPLSTVCLGAGSDHLPIILHVSLGQKNDRK